MISFIIPVYNKGPVIFNTLRSLLSNLTKAHITNYEVIVINDGSKDNSLDEAIRFKNFNGNSDKIKIYYYAENIGKGFALRYGFSKSCGDPIVFLDGDMDIDTKHVINGLNTFKQNNPQIVIGSKYHPKSRVYYPALRYFYSLVLKFLIKLLFDINVSDTQVGLKIFRRAVLTHTLPKLVIKRFAFDLELFVVAKMYQQLKVVEVPVIIKHPLFNISTVSLKSIKDYLQDMAAIYYRKHILNYYGSITYSVPFHQKQVNISSY